MKYIDKDERIDNDEYCCFDSVSYQHQENSNEEYFECESEYLDGTWCC